MARYTRTVRCAEDGCNKTAYHGFDTRADEKAFLLRLREKPYRCTRHDEPERVLRPDNRELSHVLIASRAESFVPGQFLDGLFWREEGAEQARSGYSFGPGFNAHASDFPEGTRLVVTARVELPAGETE